MGELVKFQVAAEKRRDTIAQAWERFIAAQLRSKETLTLEDGVEAGKAYREFLDLCARQA